MSAPSALNECAEYEVVQLVDVAGGVHALGSDAALLTTPVEARGELLAERAADAARLEGYLAHQVEPELALLKLDPVARRRASLAAARAALDAV